MQKLISSCLVGLLLLNVMGYYAVFLGFQYKNTIQQHQRFDSESFSEAGLITIKIPLVIPYYGDTEFIRVNGEFEHEGEFYRLVKQKFERDTLHVVCFRDVNHKKIEKALTAFVKTFNDHEQAAGRSTSKVVPSFIKDFIVIDFNLHKVSLGWKTAIGYPVLKESLIERPFSISSPPPEA